MHIPELLHALLRRPDVEITGARLPECALRLILKPDGSVRSGWGKQVPPLRRRCRSGFGRNDKSFGRCRFVLVGTRQLLFAL
jgi:hypothetical protein